MKVVSNGANLAGARAMHDARRNAESGQYHQVNARGTGAGSYISNSNKANDYLGSKYESSVSDTSRDKQYYTQLKNAAGSLQDRMEIFLKRGENALFGTESTDSAENGEEAKQPDRDKIKNQVQGFIEDYNTMLKKMESIGGKVSNIYIEQLQKQAEKYQESLKELGITKNQNGWLSLDKSLLEKADLEKIKSVFGTKDSFAQGVANISSSVEQNARNNLHAMNFNYYSSYGQDGSYSEDYSSIWNSYSSKG